MKGEHTMIMMTFNDFDEINTDAENVELTETYCFPSIQEMKNKIGVHEDYIRDILVALNHSSDSEYKRQVNKLLTEVVFLIDEEELNFSADNFIRKKTEPGELEQMISDVKNMPFQCTYWYPSIGDMQSYDWKPTINDILFLLWLIQSDMELTEDELLAKAYGQDILKKLIDV